LHCNLKFTLKDLSLPYDITEILRPPLKKSRNRFFSFTTNRVFLRGHAMQLLPIFSWHRHLLACHRCRHCQFNVNLTKCTHYWSKQSKTKTCASSNSSCKE